MKKIASFLLVILFMTVLLTSCGDTASVTVTFKLVEDRGADKKWTDEFLNKSVEIKTKDPTLKSVLSVLETDGDITFTYDENEEIKAINGKENIRNIIDDTNTHFELWIYYKMVDGNLVEIKDFDGSVADGDEIIFAYTIWDYDSENNK